MEGDRKHFAIARQADRISSLSPYILNPNPTASAELWEGKAYRFLYNGKQKSLCPFVFSFAKAKMISIMLIQSNFSYHDRRKLHGILWEHDYVVHRDSDNVAANGRPDQIRWIQDRRAT